MIDPQTLQFYQTRSREWASSLPTGQRKQLDAFLDALPAGAHILELGCGDGRDAQVMETRGFMVDASDGSPEMARLASERLGRPVPVMLYQELEAEAQYDGVWCHAALLHLPESELPGVLTRIHRALKPGGLHFASFKGGDGGHRDDFGRFYSYIPAQRLEAAYAAAGPWQAFDRHSYEGGSFGGQRALWHEITARK